MTRMDEISGAAGADPPVRANAPSPFGERRVSDADRPPLFPAPDLSRKG